MNVSCTRRVGGAGRCPTVRAGAVRTAGVEGYAIRSGSAPDDHFITCPDRRMTGPAFRRVSGAGSGPTIYAGNVSPACV